MSAFTVRLSLGVDVIGGATVADKYDEQSAGRKWVRELLRNGELTAVYDTAPAQTRRRLRAAVYAIVWPLVFNVLTKPLEVRRGHPACAKSVHRMTPECHDAFSDDAAAVVDWVLRHATVPVESAEAWIAGRIKTITIDAHRQRRGDRGAQQRPRVAKWLASRLGGDAWLIELAGSVLTWVGLKATAGTALWPIDSWAERRAVVLGEAVPSEAATLRDLDQVLQAMQARPDWYEQYVEQPLGRKEAPVSTAPRAVGGDAQEPQPLDLTPVDERDEAALTGVAAAAVEAICERIGHGEEPRTVVADVLRKTFGADDPADGIDRVPGSEPAHAERVRRMIEDPAELDRIVDTALKALRLS
jgi:hypothetical protein